MDIASMMRFCLSFADIDVFIYFLPLVLICFFQLEFLICFSLYKTSINENNLMLKKRRTEQVRSPRNRISSFYGREITSR